MFSFIHAADLHIDSPLHGLEQYEGAPVDVLRHAPRRACEALVDLAVDRHVDFVLIAGDLYDGDWKDHTTGLFFCRQMSRLREAGIPAVLISGNHDAQSKITRSLKLPDNVLHLSADRPETARHPKFAELGVAIHGQSFARQAVTENIARDYPAAQPGVFNIGMLHTSLDGMEGHDNYAPCSLDDLLQKGYDYWALGHIHKRQVLHEVPWIVYSGNVQGRHMRETGAKGCYLVRVESGDDVSLEFCPLDVIRWQLAEVNLDAAAASADDLLKRFHESLKDLLREDNDRPLAIRVLVKGTTRFHHEYLADQEHWLNNLRAVAIDAGVDRVWIEKVQFLTALPTAAVGAGEVGGPWEGVAAALEQLRTDAEYRREVLNEFDELIRKLPEPLAQEYRIGASPNERWESIFAVAEAILQQRLRGG